jgi:DNA polymerase III delta prime subunit
LVSQTTPKWSREIDRFLSVKPQFVLWGNIHDQYPLETENGLALFNLPNYLHYYLRKEGYVFSVNYEPAQGFTLLGEQGAERNAKNETLIGEITGRQWRADTPFQPRDLAEAAEIMEILVGTKKASNQITVNFASRLNDLPQEGIEEFFFRLNRLSRKCAPVFDKESRRKTKYNLLFWVLDKTNDLPAWYALDNPKVRVLPIPKPDNYLRRFIVDHFAKTIKGFGDVDAAKQEQNITMFTDQTSGLFASEINSIIQIAREDDIGFLQIGDAIQQYKLGITENPWARLPKSKIKNAEAELSKKVMGQEQAVAHAADILRRSFYNLSGSQYSRNSQRPKGVLFCAGPTGVGKTELAKAITELLFGSVTSYIRFDMSEFSHEHADQRLLGAPPGYLGYDTGGELTNAIKQNPFSVVLFDEIEKAHHKILDIFLQILDDGRLTSGSGETVYFSESLIIFTSNLGVYKRLGQITELNVSASDDPKTVREKIEQSIREYFIEIKRPEILNRIGDNIVVFDFIRPEIAVRIFDRMLGNILGQLEDDHKIKLVFAEETKRNLVQYATEDLSMGGRGVGNALERILINPISRELFEMEAESGDCFKITDIAEADSGWKITLIKS